MSEGRQGESVDGLAQLESELARDLELLNYPPASWTGETHDHSGPASFDVVIVGAGMCGLTAAFALARQGLNRLVVLDGAAVGREGPWVTYARMRTLRSPKHLTGPALGLPRLTFRAWYEAQWGAASWRALDRIERGQWMDYLRWYRRVLSIPVVNETRVERLTPCNGGFRVEVSGASANTPLEARKVVLATGREGLGKARIPQVFAPIYGTRCQHSSETIDFDALVDKRVAVVGIGASAFDNAACALEAGAERVDVLARAHAMPRLNKAKGIVYAGFTEGFQFLPASLRFEIFEHIARCRVAPPRSALLRVARHLNFALHLASPVERVTCDAQSLVLHTPRANVVVDHVILGTGFRIDLNAAKELEALSPHIMRWRDLPQFSDSKADDEEYLDFPYLGSSMQFLPRHPEQAQWCQNLYCFNLAAQLSHGNVSSDIPAVSDGAERLARGICRDLFISDVEQHVRALHDYDDPELLGDEFPIEAWWPPVVRRKERVRASYFARCCKRLPRRLKPSSTFCYHVQ